MSLVRFVLFYISSLERVTSCVTTHGPQGLCRTRRKNCVSALNCVLLAKVNIHSVFACQAFLHLGLRVSSFYPCRSLRSNASTSLLCAGLYFHESLYLTLPILHQVMMSASGSLSDHPTRNLACLLSFVRLRTRTRSRNPATSLDVSTPVCASWRFF